MAKTRKKPAEKPKADTTSSAVAKKSKTTLRERNKKAAESKDKPRRMRKAATQAKRPVSGAAKLLSTEFHVMPRSDSHNFFTKSRRATPKYFVESMAELKNVTWPGRSETWKLVFAVFVFAMFMGGFIAILDFGLERAFRNVVL